MRGTDIFQHLGEEAGLKRTEVLQVDCWTEEGPSAKRNLHFLNDWGGRQD